MEQIYRIGIDHGGSHHGISHPDMQRIHQCRASVLYRGIRSWAQVLIYLCEITFTIALTVGACKGAQSLTGRALGL